MYANIPKIGTMDIITNMPKINSIISETIQNEIIHIVNYFQFEQKHYKQTDWLAVGAATSAILAEAYIQNMEHKQIYQIIIKHQIIVYFGYVDDILIIYDKKKQTKPWLNSVNNNLL
jgi:hypothetical protein